MTSPSIGKCSRRHTQKSVKLSYFVCNWLPRVVVALLSLSNLISIADP